MITKKNYKNYLVSEKKNKPEKGIEIFNNMTDLKLTADDYCKESNTKKRKKEKFTNTIDLKWSLNFYNKVSDTNNLKLLKEFNLYMKNNQLNNLYKKNKDEKLISVNDKFLNNSENKYNNNIYDFKDLNNYNNNEFNDIKHFNNFNNFNDFKNNDFKNNIFNEFKDIESNNINKDINLNNFIDEDIKYSKINEIDKSNNNYNRFSVTSFENNRPSTPISLFDKKYDNKKYREKKINGFLCSYCENEYDQLNLLTKHIRTEHTF